MPKYVTEFIGTFFLVLTIGLTVLGKLPVAPLAIGAALMVMVYMGGHVSGAHYNPAVSTALLVRGKLSAAQFLPYVISQVLGSWTACMAVYAILGKTFAPAPSPTASVTAVLLTEFLYTFALALVVLNVATSQKTKGNSFYGLAIGFAIVVAAFAGGPLTGGAFNPAVGLGPSLVNAALGGGSLGSVWIYLVGPLLGASLAAGAFHLQGE